jgi:hypothetical protein
MRLLRSIYFKLFILSKFVKTNIDLIPFSPKSDFKNFIQLFSSSFISSIILMQIIAAFMFLSLYIPCL